MGRLAGKVALISGGARGQGAAETQLFVREGAAVVFGDVLDDEGKKVETAIRASGGQATYVHLNVTQELTGERPLARRGRPKANSAGLATKPGSCLARRLRTRAQPTWSRPLP